MPYPKGINVPAVREQWLAERREKVEAFDRLVSKGVPEWKAARTLGTTRPGIKSMRNSVESLEGGRRAGAAGDAQIDLGLAILACLRKPGEELTSEDIAAWCGCTKSAIQGIERRALAKVRERLMKNARDPEFAEEVGRLLSVLHATA